MLKFPNLYKKIADLFNQVKKRNMLQNQQQKIILFSNNFVIIEKNGLNKLMSSLNETLSKVLLSANPYKIEIPFYSALSRIQSISVQARTSYPFLLKNS